MGMCSMCFGKGCSYCGYSGNKNDPPKNPPYKPPENPNKGNKGGGNSGGGSGKGPSSGSKGGVGSLIGGVIVVVIGAALFGGGGDNDSKPASPQQTDTYRPPATYTPQPSYDPPSYDSAPYIPPAPPVDTRTAAELRHEYIHTLVEQGYLPAGQEEVTVYEPKLALKFAPAADTAELAETPIKYTLGTTVFGALPDNIIGAKITDIIPGSAASTLDLHVGDLVGWPGSHEDGSSVAFVEGVKKRCGTTVSLNIYHPRDYLKSGDVVKYFTAAVTLGPTMPCFGVATTNGKAEYPSLKVYYAPNQPLLKEDDYIDRADNVPVLGSEEILNTQVKKHGEKFGLSEPLHLQIRRSGDARSEIDLDVPLLTKPGKVLTRLEKFKQAYETVFRPLEEKIAEKQLLELPIIEIQ